MSSIHVTNVKDASGNAALVTESGGVKTDKLTGISTAGSISVVGEGNSTTTNLQQGLAKARHASNVTGESLFGSFNVSSLGDTATGKQQINFTNVMANDDFSAVSGSGSDSNGSARMMLIDSLGTSSYQVHAYNNSNALGDTSSSSTVHGDLA